MARTEIPFVVIDPATGNAITGASVAVAARGTGTASTIYAGETGGTTVTNPRTTDAYGRLTGWVERGAYTLTVSGGGLTTYVKNWDSAPAANSSIDGGWIGQGAIVLGLHSLTAAYVTTGTHTAFQDEGLTLTASYRASRILRLSWNSSLFTPAGSQRVKIRLLRGSTTIYDWTSPTAINTIVNESYGFSVPFLGPATAASETFKVQIAAFSATAVQSYATASAPRTLLLEDLGPQ